MSSVQTQGFARQILNWWRANRGGNPFFVTLCRFLSGLWQFTVGSLPSRRRQRYGDVDFDWDHRVDTTSATVKWRDRLLGELHSPYQATDPTTFHEAIRALPIDVGKFIFIDLGSGKGRALLMAADYPFKRVVGVELLSSLHRVAIENLEKYKSASQKCFEMQSICADAREFVFPPDPTVLYLFNPLPEAGLVKVIDNLANSLREKPRPVYVVYHHPLHGHVLARSPMLTKIAATDRYSIFASQTQRPGCGV